MVKHREITNMSFFIDKDKIGDILLTMSYSLRDPEGRYFRNPYRKVDFDSILPTVVEGSEKDKIRLLDALFCNAGFYAHFDEEGNLVGLKQRDCSYYNDVKDFFDSFACWVKKGSFIEFTEKEEWYSDSTTWRLTFDGEYCHKIEPTLCWDVDKLISNATQTSEEMNKDVVSKNDIEKEME